MKKKEILKNKDINVTYNLDLPSTQCSTVQNKENHNTCCNDATGSCSYNYNGIWEKNHIYEHAFSVHTVQKD